MDTSTKNDIKAYCNMLGTFTKGDPKAEAIEARWAKEKEEWRVIAEKAQEVLEIHSTLGFEAAKQAIEKFEGDKEKLRAKCNKLRGKYNAE